MAWVQVVVVVLLQTRLRGGDTDINTLTATPSLSQIGGAKKPDRGAMVRMKVGAPESPARKTHARTHAHTHTRTNANLATCRSQYGQSPRHTLCSMHVAPVA